MAEPTIALLREPDDVVAGLSGIRRRILDELTEPDSATGLAKRLGTTRQKVNYHLRSLESAGLVKLDHVRQRRGLEERIMRRVADTVLIDPAAFAGAKLDRRDAVGLTGVVSTATELIRNSAAIANEASRTGERVAAATLNTAIRVENPQAFHELLEDIADVIARYDNPDGGLAMRVAVSSLPHQESA